MPRVLATFLAPTVPRFTSPAQPGWVAIAVDVPGLYWPALLITNMPFVAGDIIRDTASASIFPGPGR